MSFNSNTYHTRKYRKSSLDYMTKVKDIKARALLGKAYDWEIDRIPNLIKLARSSYELYLSHKRIKEIG